MIIPRYFKLSTCSISFPAYVKGAGDLSGTSSRIYWLPAPATLYPSFRRLGWLSGIMVRQPAAAAWRCRHQCYRHMFWLIYGPEPHLSCLLHLMSLEQCRLVAVLLVMAEFIWRHIALTADHHSSFQLAIKHVLLPVDYPSFGLQQHATCLSQPVDSMQPPRFSVADNLLQDVQNSFSIALPVYESLGGALTTSKDCNTPVNSNCCSCEGDCCCACI